MTRENWEIVWKDISDGKFQDVLQFLKKTKDVPEKHLLYLLYSICTYLKEKPVNKDLILILKLIKVSKLSNNELKAYLQYHQMILRNLLTEENEKYILEMENIFIPPFFETITDEDLTIFENTVKIFFCKILEKKLIKNHELTFALLQFSAKMSLYCLNNGLIKYYKLLILHLYDSNFNIIEIQTFYEVFLKFFGKDENNFNDIIQVLGAITTNFDKQAELSKFYSLTLKYLKSDRIILNIISVIARISGKIQYDTKEFQNDLLACLKCMKSAYDNKPKLKKNVIKLSVFLVKYTLNPANLKDLKITNESLGNYLNLLQFINGVIKDENYNCCCKMNVDVDLQYLSVQFIFSLLKLKNNWFKSIPKDVWETLEKFLQDFCLNLDLMHSYKCKRLQTYWNYIGRSIYNLCLTMYGEGVLESVRFMKIFIKYILKVEGRNDKMLTDNAGIMVLNMYTSILFKNRLYKQAALMLAVGFYLYPQHKSKGLLNKWVECKCTHLKEKFTFVNILNANVDTLKYLDETFKTVSKKEVLNLYFKELGCYLTHEKIKDAENILDEIVKLKQNTVIIAENLINLGFKMVLNFPAKHQRLIEEILFNLQNEKASNVKIMLGYFNYIKYRYKLQDIILSNKVDMDNTIITKKDERCKEPKDVNDECDVVSNYYNLEIENHKKILEILIESLNYFKIINEHDGILLNEQIYETLVEMGHDFTLNCFYKEAEIAFNLSLKVAKLLKNDTNIFKSITFLMEFNNTTNIDELKILADALIKKEIPDKSYKIYYYINLCSFYLKSGEINKALILYDDIKDFQMKDGSYSYTRAAVHAKLLLLEAKIYNLPCSYKVERHYDFALIKGGNAYKLIAALSKTEDAYKETRWTLSTFFDITEYLISIYAWMYLPREIRSYGKECLILAQKLVLPFHASKLLIYLTRADLITCNFNDCIVKLEGLTEILGLNCTYQKFPMEKNDIQEISSGLHDLVLECPSTSYPRAATAGSPVLYTEPFKLPSFINHSNDCTCFFCSSIEYQKLVIYKILLDALYCDSQKYYNAVNDYYKALFLIQQKLKSQDLNEVFNEVLLNYAKYSFKMNNVKESKKIIKELIESQGTLNNYLYDEALNLQFSMSYDFEIFPKKIIKTQNKPLLPIIKTPENNCTEIKIRKTPTTVFTEKPERRRRVPKVAINFDRSPEQTTTNRKENVIPKIKPKDEILKSAVKKERKPSKLEEFSTPSSTVEKINPRTRLLTERLKSSQKLSSVENTMKKPAVRKNLVDELCDVDESKTVRRTRRAK